MSIVCQIANILLPQKKQKIKSFVSSKRNNNLMKGRLALANNTDKLSFVLLSSGMLQSNPNKSLKALKRVNF
jgi:hypothetical protein